MKMKTYSIIGLIAILAFSLTSCGDDPIDLQRGVGVVPTITDIDPALFFPGDLNSTFVGFTLDIDPVYNYTGELKIVVSMNGDNSRLLVKTVSSFPADVTITLSEVATTFGMTVNDITPGDLFTFEVVSTTNGKEYYSSAAFFAPLTCVIESDNISGSYTAFSSGWAVNGPVTLTVDPVDQYTIYVAGLIELDGQVEDLGPLEMIIDPTNNTVTAVKTVLGSNFFIYSNVAYQGSGILDTCTGTYEMNFTITVDQGSFGSYNFTLTKN